MVVASGVFGIRACCLRLQPLRPSLRRRFCGAASCSVSLNGNCFKKKKKGEKEKVIVISGPTGAGKSRLALELAKRLNGEIISADSVQVYRGLDIGSAKPSSSDMKEVPHHLIDILHPSEDYSVGQFFEDARQATRDILNSGRVPIVSGGTGLYLRWFMYGKPDVPKSSPEVIAKVHEELAGLQRADNWEGAVELVVKAGDPKARFLASNDWYRLRRSLEIIKSSGSPPSAFRVPYDSFRGNSDSVDASGSRDIDSSADVSNLVTPTDLDYEFLCFFLSSPRVDLYRSIDFRCEDMVSGREGILSEAGWLLDIGLLPNTNSATRAIGYRQAMEYLLRCRQQGGSSSPREFYGFLSEFQKVSRNFAKRQMTWFRNEPFYHWLNASKPLEMILQFICDAYEDQAETLVLPEFLKMSKDITNRRETSELKAYRPQNRYFVRRDDCTKVLEWIRRTQGCRSELVPSF